MFMLLNMLTLMHLPGIDYNSGYLHNFVLLSYKCTLTEYGYDSICLNIFIKVLQSLRKHQHN